MGLVKKLGKAIVPFALAGSMFLGGCSDSQPQYPSRLANRIKQEQAVQNHTPDKYAVLVRGDNEDRHVANFSLAYQVLLENGFQPENIYILTDNGKNEFYHPVDDVASRESLEILLTHLSKKADDKDILFFYLNDHGGRTTYDSAKGEKQIKVSEFYLNGKDINEIELESLLSHINANQKQMIFDFCYDGGFSERFGRGNDIAVSSAPKNEVSSAKVNDSFSGYFLSAFRNVSGADYNADGKISFSEAYKFAKENHSYTKSGKDHPQLISKINADEVFLK